MPKWLVHWQWSLIFSFFPFHFEPPFRKSCVRACMQNIKHTQWLCAYSDTYVSCQCFIYPSSMMVWNHVTPLVAPPNDLWDCLVHWLQVRPGKVDDYTTASNICLRISNKEYCSRRLRILINSLGPRKPWCKFKSSAAPLAIKSDNYAEWLRGP